MHLTPMGLSGLALRPFLLWPSFWQQMHVYGLAPRQMEAKANAYAEWPAFLAPCIGKASSRGSVP